MPYVMRYETWTTLTELKLRIRSKYLRAVDKALKQYHQAPGQQNLAKLQIALEHWKESKGYDLIGATPKWRLDARNGKKAIETLDMQVFGVPAGSARGVLEDLAELPFYGIEAWAGDHKARKAMKKAREQALAEMFAGKKVVVKKGMMGYALYKIRDHMKDAKSEIAAAPKQAAKAGAEAAATPLMDEVQKQAMNLLKDAAAQFPEVAQEIVKDVLDAVPTFVTDLALSMAPYLSLAKSGGQAIYNAGQAARSEYQWLKVDDRIDGFDQGDPFAAVEAVKRLIERKRNQYARVAGIYAADTGARAVGTVLDAAAHGAPAGHLLIGIPAAIAKTCALLTLYIFIVGRDYWEKYKVNNVLTDPTAKLSKVIFDTCPLLGCYYAAGATTSDILNFAVDDIGAPGWNLDVEVMKKRIEPIIGYARDAISDSRLEVEGLERSKAAVADTSSGALGLSNPKNRLKKLMVSKLSAAIPFVDDPNDYQQQGYQTVNRDVLKSRITGQGPRT